MLVICFKNVGVFAMATSSCSRKAHWEDSNDGIHDHLGDAWNTQDSGAGFRFELVLVVG